MESEDSVNNNADTIIVHTDICAENVTNIVYPTRKATSVDFSCGSSNLNVLRK